MKRSDIKGWEYVPVSMGGWHVPTPPKVSEEKIVAAAGAPVICPKCGDHIGRISIPIYTNMQIRADAVEFLDHQRRKAKDKAECVKCGEPYMKHRMQHRDGVRSFTTQIYMGKELGWV